MPVGLLTIRCTSSLHHHPMSQMPSLEAQATACEGALNTWPYIAHDMQDAGGTPNGRGESIL